MNCLPLYSWILGSKNSFLKVLQKNDAWYDAGKKFWTQLEANSFLYVVMFITVAALLVYWYYKPFNEMPGRHYKIKYWAYFGIAALVLSFVLTFGYVYVAIPTSSIEGALLLELKLAFANALYSAFIYFIFSCVWCKIFPTNAYRFI